jgi:hypothetical protein
MPRPCTIRDRARASHARGVRRRQAPVHRPNESPRPAAVATPPDYLADLAQQVRKASTNRRAREVIGAVHAELGLPQPDRDGRIRRLERGIGRIHGKRETRACVAADHGCSRASCVLTVHLPAARKINSRSASRRELPTRP